jgi:hypothetical protein
MVWKKYFEQYIFVKILPSCFLNVNIKLGRIHAKPPDEFDPKNTKQDIDTKGGRDDCYDSVEYLLMQNNCDILCLHNEVPVGSAQEITDRITFQETIGIYCTVIFEKANIEQNGRIDIPSRFQEFGDCAIIITNPVEWFRRISEATQNHPHIKCCRVPNEEAWCGKIDYIKLNEHQRRIGYFKKDIEFSWQSEFRMTFMDNREVDAVNLDIGSIEDISEVVFFNYTAES